MKVRFLALTLFFALPVAAPVLVGPSSEAIALTLPPSSITSRIVINNTIQDQNDSTSISNSFSLGGNSGSIVANVQPSPHITASASAAPGGNQTVSHATLQYWFGIEGPVGVDVPIIITAHAQTTDTNVLTQAVLSLTTSSFGNTIAYACSSNGGNACNGSSGPSFSVALPFSILSETLNILTMTLQVVANTNVDPTGPDSSSAFIDPIITIDPSFARINEFRLAFSDGVGNSPIAVPLPAALPLFATILAGGGLIAWRRKRKAALVK